MRKRQSYRHSTSCRRRVRSCPAAALTMRRAFCPEYNCGHQPVLFRPADTFVMCPECTNGIRVEKLRGVVKSKSEEQEAEWLVSKASLMLKRGQFGVPQSEMVSGTIDGFLGYDHVLRLRPIFEQYGMTSEDEVKQLSKMGRTEPMPAENISDYAFGIRPEHIDVFKYGMSQAAASYLSNTMKAVNKENNLPMGALSLIPLLISNTEWMVSGAEAISRACVGREVFGNRLVIEAEHHYNEFYADYISHETQSDIDLAIFANVIGRTIMLLDAEWPFTVNVFLPFLCIPQDCKDLNGKKRSPLVLARTNRFGTHRAALVATAGPQGITQIRLSRKWFKPIWSATNKKDADEQLKKYVDFDGDGRCVVANGKYFKPAFLRRVVKAFEQADIRNGHVNPRLLAEFLRDYRSSAMIDVDAQVMNLSMENRLWRCVHCETLLRSDDTTKRSCWKCKSEMYLRKQSVDGTVEYVNGDHTRTPAPKSWCFMKRRHFFNGIEYDNPPLRIEVQVPLRKGIARDEVHWFSGESNRTLNSDVANIVQELIKNSLPIRIDDKSGLITSQIVEGTSESSMVEHRNDHFRECLGRLRFGIETLLDGHQTGQKQMRDDGQESKPKHKTVNVDGILAMGNDLTKHFLMRMCEIQSAVSVQGETTALKQEHEDACIVQANVEDSVFHQLEAAFTGIRDEERVRIICSKQELFEVGGLYFHRAKRLHLKDEHFILPLLGDVKFVFNATGDWIEACTPNGHQRIQDCVKQICILALEPCTNCYKSM